MSAFVIELSRSSDAAIVRNCRLRAILTIRSFINEHRPFYRKFALITCNMRSIDSVIVVLSISN